VLLDDTDLVTTDPAAAELTRYGLGRIDFWGFKPGVHRMTCTTIFSWDFNHWLVPGAKRSAVEAPPAPREPRSAAPADARP
jgi:hypothetical protein